VFLALVVGFPVFSACGREETLFNKSVLHIVEFRWQEVTVTVNKNELKLVLDKLDTVKLELLRLRAMLLTEEEASEGEKREIEAARKEIAKGSKVSLDDLVKELC
jgi:ribosomal protein L29